MSEQVGVECAPGAETLPARLSEWQWDTGNGPVKLSVEMVRRYFCPKATEPEVMHFMAVCKYHRLNPWLREAYLIKYQDGEAAQIVVGRDTHARRAEEHAQYAGDEGGIIVQNAKGEIEEREGEFFSDGESLLGGWARVYRKDRPKPIVHRVRLQDWIQYRRDGSPARFWKSMPAHMIAKVARAQCRHEAFPTDFSGMLSEDEAGAARQLSEQTFQMPLSVAEAQAQDSAGNGQSGESLPEASPARAPEEQSGEGGISPDEQSEIRKREHTEASASPSSPEVEAPRPSQRADRSRVWTAVLRRAKAENKSAGTVLHELTNKRNMPDLDDDEVLALAKKLGL